MDHVVYPQNIVEIVEKLSLNDDQKLKLFELSQLKSAGLTQAQISKEEELITRLKKTLQLYESNDKMQHTVK